MKTDTTLMSWKRLRGSIPHGCQNRGAVRVMLGTQKHNWIPLPNLVIKMNTHGTLVALQSHNMFEINNH